MALEKVRGWDYREGLEGSEEQEEGIETLCEKEV